MLLLRSRSRPRLARPIRWIRPTPPTLVWALLLALSQLVAGGVSAVAAQAGLKWPTHVGFTWPDTAVDVSRYETVEECLAATDRVIEAEAKRERITTNVWYDTLPYNPRVEGPSRDESAVVTTTAVRCTARFSPTELMGSDYDHHQDSLARFRLLKYIMRVYLLANRDADAAAFIAERVAAEPASRRAIEDVAIAAYHEALPVRAAALEPLYTSYLSDSSPPAQRYVIYTALLGLATSVGDTARARSHRAQLVAAWPQLEPGNRQRVLAPEDVKPGGQAVFDRLAAFYREALLDTLRRHGTARYVAARAALFTQLAGVAPAEVSKFSKLNEFHKLVGRPAPAIVGDFWYGRGDSTASRPSRGRVGIVVFIDPTAPGRVGASPETTDSSATSTVCFPHRNSREELEADFRRRADGRHETPACWAIPAVLRRLAERFPALEVTLVTQTYGSLVYTAYPKEPAKEAELIRQWLHGAHRAPGALAVTATSYRYLPEPDGRITHRLTVPNTDNYFSGVGETWSYSIPLFGRKQFTPIVPHGSAFLVDHEGVIATALVVDRTKESELAEVIDILLQRSGAVAKGPGVAAPAAPRGSSRP